jgi:hypothetical protein
MAQPPALGNTNTGSMVDRAWTSAFPGSLAGASFFPSDNGISHFGSQPKKGGRWQVAG